MCSPLSASSVASARELSARRWRRISASLRCPNAVLLLVDLRGFLQASASVTASASASASAQPAPVHNKKKQHLPLQRLHLHSPVCRSRASRAGAAWAAPEWGQRALGRRCSLDDTMMEGAPATWRTSSTGVHYIFSLLGIQLLQICRKSRPCSIPQQLQHQPIPTMAAVYKHLSGNDRDEERPTGEKRNKQRVLILVRLAPQIEAAKLILDRAREVSRSATVICCRICTH